MTTTINAFLLIGQSNMAGRGRLEDVSILNNPQVSMFREGQWVRAVEPLHTDKPRMAGIGLGMSFAHEVLESTQEGPVGLIPCAVGGTPLSRWMPGADLYEDAVSIAKEALKNGVLKGILWHQGEGDSGASEDASSYSERFLEMICSLRSELSADDVPVLVGEMGEFLEDREDVPYFKLVNKALSDLEGVVPSLGFVSSEGLTDKGDNLHFNAKSLREFGSRYARAYLDMIEGEGTDL